MKLCPFLVAGQSQGAPARSSTIPIAPASGFATPDLDAILQATPVASQDVVPGTPFAAPAGGIEPRLTGVECLGEPCRFFHQGGCRFDALFESQAVAAAAGSGGIPSPTPGDAGVLEEVWSLQRESLREVMGGFRKLESAQAALQEGVATRVESRLGGVASQVETVGSQVERVNAQVGRVESSVGKVTTDVTQAVASVERVASQVGEAVAQVGKVEGQVGQVDGRVAQVESVVAGVESQVKRVESQVAAVHGSVGRIESELRAFQAELQKLGTQVESAARPATNPEVIDLVGRHFEALERDVRQLETVVRAAVKETQVVAQQAAAASEVGLRAALESMRAGVETTVVESHAAVRTTVSESQAALGKLLATASNETRAQVERGLAKLLEEMGQVRDTRGQIQAALDGLVRETREVGVLARRVESSQVLTTELLDEQRQAAAKVDARERRERARQVNNAGVLSYHQGAYDTSVERFRQATELDPTLAEAFNNLGLSYTEMGRDEEASVAFQRALELDPSAGHVYNNLGYLYYRKGDLDHAVDMYQRAIQRGADTSAAYTNLANAFYRLKRVDQAVASWRRAVEVDPGNHKAAAALERLGLDVRPAARPV